MISTSQKIADIISVTPMSTSARTAVRFPRAARNATTAATIASTNGTTDGPRDALHIHAHASTEPVTPTQTSVNQVGIFVLVIEVVFDICPSSAAAAQTPA